MTITKTPISKLHKHIQFSVTLNWRVKCITILLLTLLSISSYAQITFTKSPINGQLVGRNLSTNLGQVTIEGHVDNRIVDYSEIQIDKYRNNVYVETFSTTLNYVQNISAFNFSISIPAELANYSFKIYGKNGNALTLEKEIFDIVAGDVYIIQGQSNAEAPMFNGDVDVFQHNFIRVYAGGFDNEFSLLSNDRWYLAQGNGHRNTDGNVGQWGLKTAYSIVSSTDIPVAIFNGAHSGKQIDFFQAQDDYQITLDSNYSRLYHRLNKTNLKDFVRGVLWAQGETDASIGTTIDQYKDKFIALKNSWLTDYPNIEHIYIFQTKNGCGVPLLNLIEIKEAQRQLADENPDITIIPTAATTHHSDDCHFPLVNGYEVFSDRLSPLIQRDLYNVSTSLDIDAPMIQNAWLSDSNTLIVETDSKTALEIKTVAEDFYLLNGGEDISNLITNISVENNNIVFSLSETPAIGSTITYLAQISGTGNFITNANNLELICFHNYTIDASNVLSSTDFDTNQKLKIFPNPSVDTIQVLGVTDTKQFQIYDLSGFRVLTGSTSNEDKIYIQNLPIGMYVLKLETGEVLKFVKE